MLLKIHRKLLGLQSVRICLFVFSFFALENFTI